MNELKGDLPEGFKMTELGPLPEEWEVINLNEVIDLRRGVSWRKEEANREGIGVPVIGIPNIKENGSIDFSDTYFLNKNISKEKILRINDILFVGSSGSIKNIGRNILIREIPQNRFTYASFTFLGRVNSTKVDNKYLFYLLNSPVVDFTKYARRASDGKYNFQLTQFKNEQKLPLPPLPEQRKIADILSTVQEAKEKTEAVIDANRDLKKSMMNYLFTYGPVPIVDAENVLLKETEIGMIPEEWEVVRLGDVADFKNGINFTANQKGGKGILTVDVLNMYGESIYVSLNNLYRVNKVIDKDYLLKEGDLLFVRSSLKREGVGWTSLFKPKDEPVTFCGFIIRARLKDKSILPEYITNYMRTDTARTNLVSSSGKVAITNINQGMLGNIKIPLPPLPTQQKIASMLSAIDEKIEAEENKKKALEDLFKTLLHNLMTAKIRVNNLEVGA